MVLTNPPFGKKSSYKVINAEGDTETESMSYLREDFWATTSNKQLNFLQHVRSLLKINGRAAIVVPDNVLFEGGAGETVRRKLLEQCDVHTLLRLPTGIFYAGGVKANVLFFDRKPPSERPWTKKLWIYDFRTNQSFTLKERQLARSDLDDFVACYNADNREERAETERFKPFTYEELLARDKASLDIFWLRDESLEDTDNLPAPEVIAAEIVEDLQAALDEFSAIASTLSADTPSSVRGGRLSDTPPEAGDVAGGLGSPLVEAVAEASRYHADQFRKGTQIPYLAHLLSVAALVLEDGGSEQEAIAALLHGAVEDAGGKPTLQGIRERFGDEVAMIVEACSDTDVVPKPPWRKRKEDYLAHLADEKTPESVLRVSLADKLHNARAILSDYRRLGDDLWSRFNTKSGDDQLWYYRSLAKIFLSRLPGAMSNELDHVVKELDWLVATGFDGAGLRKRQV